jgi:tRNA(fMet)-specific endonuclease VapC
VDFVADTTLLVGLWRRQEWACRFAETHARKTLVFSWVVLGEFWHGATRAGHDPGQVAAFLELGIPYVDATPAIRAYGDLCAGLQSTQAYQEIGQNDLWIAAVALALKRPLVSRNTRHFDKVPGLEVIALD